MKLTALDRTLGANPADILLAEADHQIIVLTGQIIERDLIIAALEADREHTAGLTDARTA